MGKKPSTGRERRIRKEKKGGWRGICPHQHPLGETSFILRIPCNLMYQGYAKGFMKLSTIHLFVGR